MSSPVYAGIVETMAIYTGQNTEITNENTFNTTLTTVQTPIEYRPRFNAWSAEDCLSSHQTWNPHLADNLYQSIEVQSIQQLKNKQDGDKIHLQGYFSAQKDNFWQLKDQTGNIALSFRKEFYCNQNSAKLVNQLSKADIFGTLRMIDGQPAYIELDYYQQDNLFDLGFSHLSSHHRFFISRTQLEQFAHDGFEPAQAMLANVYATGQFNHFQTGREYLPIQPEQVVYWLEKASRTDIAAKNMLTWAYDEGYGGLVKDRTKAFALFNQTLFVVDLNWFYQQEAEAQQLLQNKNYTEALEKYILLNERLPHSQLQTLGEIYFALGDYDKARYYLERYLVTGFISNSLARIYVEGLGVKANPEYGVALLQYVAENDAQSALTLAHYYAKGQFIDRNLILAKQYYQQVVKLTEKLASSYQEDKILHQHATQALKKLRFIKLKKD